MKIETRGLAKRYRSTLALDDFSLTLEPGRVVAVIGLNGAGKTTLLRCLGGLIHPQAGEIFFDGEKFSRKRLDLRRRMAFLPDSPICYAEHTPLKHIAMTVRVYGISPDSALEQRVVGLLSDFDLLEVAKWPLGELSRGQLYKCALAAHAAVRPELWLLDEPFASGIDPRGIATFKRLARERAADGGTVIYTTQILEIAEKFADELVVIDRGRLRQTITRAELDAMPADGPDSLQSVLDEFREIST